MPAVTATQRTPYVAALALLILIWTVWAFAPHAHSYTPSIIDLVPEPPSVLDSAVQDVPIPVDSPSEPKVPIQADKGAFEAIPTTAVSAPAADLKVPEPTSTSQHGTGKAVGSKGDRPLILYAYAEAVPALINLKFFIKHGLHANADFVFIINGETNATALIPKASNINIIQRPNDCYDLGAYAEVLTAGDRWKAYKRFILLNASIRGPFLPHWAESCWSDRYLSRVTDTVKLVGMTGNCWPRFHVQSMIWATDAVGMSLLLYPPQPTPTTEMPTPAPEHGINSCFHTWDTAVAAEIGATKVIQNGGYKIDVMMSRFHSDAQYIEHCDSTQNGDVLWNGGYSGTNVHPYETIFLKTNRDIDPILMERLSEWTTASNYTSYDHC